MENLEILFENKTKYTKDEINNFIKFHTNKYILKYIICTILIVIYFGVLIIFNLVYKNWTSFLGSIIIAIMAYFYYKTVYVGRKKETNKKQLEQEYTFDFFERIYGNKISKC